MKAVEFHTQVNPDQTLAIPPEVAALLSGQQNVRVLLLIPEASEDQEWERLTAEEFLQGYSESDAIYDELPVG
jgi:hypothetical protein